VKIQNAKWQMSRDGLGIKNPRGNMFYKDHRDIAEKASQHFKKASISLKMYLKSLNFSEKVQKKIKSL
jgi:hypothetical protein